jgi:hypothetical protein
MILLYLATVIVLMMLVWFKTDFVVDWGSTFGLHKLIKEGEYLNERVNFLPAMLNYPTFLKMKYPSFLTKLVGCPLCVSFWLSVAFLTTLSILTFQPLTMLLVPPLCILSLFIYGVITKLVNIS